VHTIYCLKSGYATWSRVSLRFISLPALRTLWVTFQAKNNVKNAPASTELTQVSHFSHNASTANHHLSASGERNGAQKWTKVSFGRTMMQALALLQLVKRHIFEWNNIEQWRNQACSYSHYWDTYTCLSTLVS